MGESMRGRLPLLSLRVLATLLFTFRCDAAVAQRVVFEKRLDGVVVDASTSQPVAGVRVIAAWIQDVGQPFHGSTRICRQVSGAMSGEDGRFSLKGPDGMAVETPLDATALLLVHKAGWEELPRDQWEKSSELRVPLRPASASRVERLQFLLKLTDGLLSCKRKAAETSEWRAFLQSASREATGLARSGWEQAAARVIALRAANPKRDSYENDVAEWDILGSTTNQPSGEVERDEGHALFLKAIHDADVDAVRTAIVKGADINRIGWRRRSVLTVALQEYYQATLEAPSESGRRWQVLKTLLAAPGLNPDGAGPGQHTPLMIALTHERVEEVQALLAAGADPNLSVGESPIMFATRQHGLRTGESASRVEAMFSAIATHPRARLGEPLCAAVIGQWPQTVQALLDAGADPEVKCWMGEVPLVYLVGMPPAMIKAEWQATLVTLSRSPRIARESRELAVRRVRDSDRDAVTKIIRAGVR